MATVGEGNRSNFYDRDRNMQQRCLKLVDGPAESIDSQLSDDELMRLVKSGHKSAFEALFRRHRDLVYGFAVRYLSSRVWGRDVTQDVFLSLWVERERYRPRGKFRSYLISVVLHRCQYVARQRASDLFKASQFARTRVCDDVVDGSLEELLEKENIHAVREKLAELPPKLCEVMVLRFVNGLSLQEIAELRRIPVGTVKVRVFRGLKRLQGMLEEQSQ